MKKSLQLPVIKMTGTGILMCLLVLTGCRKFEDHNTSLKHFSQVNLVDNNHEYGAPNLDPLQLNSWGIAFSPNGIAWVNAQAGHVSALYDREGATVRPAVNIPSTSAATGGSPTGIVFNGSGDLILSNSAAARFIFVGTDGVLSGWNQQSGDNAELIADHSETSAYTGLALAAHEGNNYLYAADFRSGSVVVWDKDFQPVNMSFDDPGLPSGYSPFNIASVGDRLYVLYAKPGTDGRAQKGDGLGYVSIFTTNGEFVKRFASGGALNAPWGIAKAPDSFFAGLGDDNPDSEKGHGGNGRILIGNFGNGYINVYDDEGKLLGPLKTRGNPIQIHGLWAITFPPATSDIDPDRLYFAAGPDDEEDGLFGYLIKR